MLVEGWFSPAGGEPCGRTGSFRRASRSGRTCRTWWAMNRLCMTDGWHRGASDPASAG